MQPTQIIHTSHLANATMREYLVEMRNRAHPPHEQQLLMCSKRVIERYARGSILPLVSGLPDYSSIQVRVQQNEEVPVGIEELMRNLLAAHITQIISTCRRGWVTQHIASYGLAIDKWGKLVPIAAPDDPK